MDDTCFGERMGQLPNELLHSILHTVGRPTRRVCNRWHVAYGPLTGGVYLTSIQNTRQFRRITTLPTQPLNRRPAQAALHPRSPRFSQVVALCLDPPFPSAIIPKLPAAFSTLRTLHLRTLAPLSSSTLAAFAPWAPTLTSLTLTHPDADTAAATTLATTLTALRSLTLLPPRTLHVNRTTPLPLFKTLIAVRYFHNLNSFTWQQADGNHPDDIPAGDMLLPLAQGAPHLTRLVLDGVRLALWDAAAVETLATAWPSLASLHLHIHPVQLPGLGAQGDPPSAHAIMAALAQRTALTSLTLNINDDLPYATLALLRLRELSLVQEDDYDSQTAFDGLLPAMATAGTLTRLVIDRPSVAFGPQLGAELLLLAGSLVKLDLKIEVQRCSHLGLIGQLTGLQSLALRLAVASDDEAWGTPGAAWVDALTGGLSLLTHLHLSGLPTLAGPLNRVPLQQDGILRGLARHGKLQEVELLDPAPSHAPVVGALGGLALSLVRLHLRFCYPCSKECLVQALGMLRGMEQLQHLELVAGYVGRSLVSGCSLTNEGGVITAGSRNGSSSGSSSVQQQEQGPEGDQVGEPAEAMVLPPRLRVLVITLQELTPQQQTLVCAVARAQDCSVRPNDSDVAQSRPRAWDDCSGYGQQGAAAAL